MVDSGMMARQEALKLVLPDKVAVIGCGGVGSQVVYHLAMAGVPEIWVFDFDNLEEHNLNRIPVPLTALGKNKGKAMAEEIKRLRPGCEVVPMGRFTVDLATKLSLKKEQFAWVVCTTDSLASRKEVRGWVTICRDKNSKPTRYIEASAEGEWGGCTGEPADWATPAEENPGYQSVPVWDGPCVMAAVSACYYVLHDQLPEDDNVRLGWEEGPDMEGRVRGVFTAQVHSEHEIVLETEEEEGEQAQEEKDETRNDGMVYETDGGDWSTTPITRSNGDQHNSVGDEHPIVDDLSRDIIAENSR